MTTGPMDGVRVVELASPFTAFAGKLLADAGADVVVVEPPGGALQRGHGPFADDQPGVERSLAWWAENTSKRGIVIDLDDADGRDLYRQLVATADVVLEAEGDRLADLCLDHVDLVEDCPDLIHLAINPFGRSGPRGGEQITDLTLLAGGGPMWSCGYDDHSLPPVRGCGEQGFRMSAHFAVMSVLTALLARPVHGGQFIDLSMNAAANVTTEFASYSWLAGQATVQRQTGRHATPTPTEWTQVQCADGRWLNTGVPPRTGPEFAALRDWIVELDLVEDFPLFSLLELSDQYELLTLQLIEEDPLAGELFGAGREALHLIASRVSAHEAFLGFQDRGIAVGVVWSPDEVMSDPHFVARDFPTEVEYGQIGRSALHAGAPIRFTESPMGISSRAPMLDEHGDEIRTEMG
ncbi:MAG: carnitine dehydratase [Actinomycetia bacterium]|nr:carnitine dehydratase [Actinomycetes bacterium]MCP3913824.1 carnitine dehydratase [Actinomycetes bacterium]MCP4083622.1 carnitine dehydratase [Actinomycetes bacterium]